MSRQRKTREQRAAETERILAQVEASRATQGGGGAGEELRTIGRGFVDELLFLLLQAALLVVPALVGLVVDGGQGLLVGFGVGLVLLAVFWVVVLVTGVRGGRRAWREGKRSVGR